MSSTCVAERTLLESSSSQWMENPGVHVPDGLRTFRASPVLGGCVGRWYNRRMHPTPMELCESKKQTLLCLATVILEFIFYYSITWEPDRKAPPLSCTLGKPGNGAQERMC